MKKSFFIFPLCMALLMQVSILGQAVFAQDYLIGPDDVLSISVYREDELNRRVGISHDGYFSFPLIGQVEASGKTVAELKTSMEMMLKKYLKNPHVNIFIEKYSTITVSGQVMRPGEYELKSNLTVLEAISLAGGFSKIAAQNAVKIMRTEAGESKTIIVRVADIVKKGREDVVLERGDVVFVPESLF
ncbi:MAG: polysaccharide biosynthesis/export family protein [Candidatus Omnitrophota bacterium]